MKPPVLMFASCFFLCICNVLAHPEHEADESHVEPAAAGLPDNQVTIRVEGDKRIIESNGIPDHDTGNFPNRKNPSRITPQTQRLVMPAAPIPAPHFVPSTHLRIGVALNGVVFDPVTAEFWRGNPEWKYEAIVDGKRLLGLDDNNAHVQPDGTYHYHGIPIDLIKRLKADKTMVQIGWAADGFPIYGPMAYKDPKNPASGLAEMKPSYAMKKGQRPSQPHGPGGRYDGAFGADFEYVEGSGDLDECNGRFGITPEFPAGTYYYVLTDSFPYIPRIFRGFPDPSFNHQAPPSGHPRGGQHHPPPRRL